MLPFGITTVCTKAATHNVDSYCNVLLGTKSSQLQLGHSVVNCINTLLDLASQSLDWSQNPVFPTNCLSSTSQPNQIATKVHTRTQQQ